MTATPFGRTEDGFETQFGINDLGHFTLVQGAIPLLLKAGDPRVVLPSSRAHRLGDIDFATRNTSIAYMITGKLTGSQSPPTHCTP